MKRLWAPWRDVYLRGRRQGCFLCRYRRDRQDSKHFVVQRTSHSLSLLNLYPYNNGHILIAPKRHVKDLDELSRVEREDLINLFVTSKRLCQKVLKPQGFNSGINFGRAAGAGLEDHLHIHLVPRWSGDTNFMPLVSGTKVISQSLKALYSLLRAQLNRNLKHKKR